MLTNMAMTKEEIKEYKGDMCCASPDDSDAPKYPWGLTISLDDGSIEKLGLTDLPPVGTTMLIQAQVTVTSVRSNQQASGDVESSLDLQITDMEVSAPGKTSETIAASLYK